MSFRWITASLTWRNYFRELFVLLIGTRSGSQTFEFVQGIFLNQAARWCGPSGKATPANRLNRACQHFKDISAEMEGHELGEAEGDRKMVLDRVEQRPEALTIDPFSVHGETGRLKCL